MGKRIKAILSPKREGLVGSKQKPLALVVHSALDEETASIDLDAVESVKCCKFG